MGCSTLTNLSSSQRLLLEVAEEIAIQELATSGNCEDAKELSTSTHAGVDRVEGVLTTLDEEIAEYCPADGDL